MAKKGYLVVCYEGAVDSAVHAEYAKIARPAIAAGGGRLIAAGQPAKTYESGVNQRLVIFEFDSVEQAIAAFESDAYKAALKVFKNAAPRDIRVVEGV